MLKATVNDLTRVKQKAELIRGRIVYYMPNGHLPSIVARRIFRKIADYVDDFERGFAFTGSIGFAVPELYPGGNSFRRTSRIIPGRRRPSR